MSNFDARKRLEELKEMDLPVLTIEKLCEADNSFKIHFVDKATEEELKYMKEYLSHFYYAEDNKCLFTQEIPCLEWGLCHGVTYDTNSGLNWKTYHYFDVNGENKKYIRSLQYHPNEYSIRKDD